MRARVDPWLFGALLVGAVSVLAGLGASSLFVDEVLSWQAARLPVSHLHDKVLADEVAPDTYFLGLHGWIVAFGDSEWVMRLPSAVAAIALVGAVWWLAVGVADRSVAAVAAGLCAVSPLVLQYGQQVRAYVFAMLAVTLATGAAVRCARADGDRRGRWFAATLALCVASFWIHYTAGLVVFAILLWLLAARGLLTAGRRVLGVGVAAFLCAGLLPQIEHQTALHPGGLEGFAGMTFRNAAKVVAAPFDGRISPGDLLQAVAAALCGIALVHVLSRRGGAWTGVRGVALLAVVPLLAVFARTLAGDADVLTSRYVAVAAPLILVVVAAWVVSLPKGPGIAAAVTLAAVGVTGSVRAHLPEGHESDVRALTRHVAEHASPGEAIVVSDVVGLTTFSYYIPRELPAGFPAFSFGDTRWRSAPGIWLVVREGIDRSFTPEALATALGFSRPGEQRRFEANAPYVVTHLRR